MVKRYLRQVSLVSAGEILSYFEPPVHQIFLQTSEAVGRVIAAPLCSRFTVPPVSCAAMDGYAVCASETTGASDQHPVILEKAHRINTGNPVPEGFDAVILIEDIWEENGTLKVRKSARPLQHIRPAGEDVKEGAVVIPAGHLLRSLDVGPLLSYGITEVSVLSLKAGLLPTGSEIVEPGTLPDPGQVIESNMAMAGAWLSPLGIEVVRYPIVADEPEIIAEAVKKGVEECDILLISAGSSAGTRDFTASVIASEGELLIHGVAIIPGKPVIIGQISSRPVICLPGYPLAAQTVIREIVMPALEGWGFTLPQDRKVRAILSQDLASDPGFDEFVWMGLARIRGEIRAVPLSRGAGVQMAQVRAGGFLHIPPEIEGIEKGAEVEINLTVREEAIEKTVMIAGAPHQSLDEYISSLRDAGSQIVFRDVGNLSGLLAFRNGGCHAASVTIEAQEEDDHGGAINSYVSQYLAGINYHVVLLGYAGGTICGLVVSPEWGDSDPFSKEMVLPEKYLRDEQEISQRVM